MFALGRSWLASTVLSGFATGPALAQVAMFEERTVVSRAPGGADSFGFAVALQGGRLFSGAPLANAGAPQCGEVQVFDLGPPAQVLQVLSSGDGLAGDAFGSTLAVDGDLLVVGAPNHDHGALDAGSAYVFRWTGSAWVQEAELLASDRAAGDAFGVSVDISGATIAVGAPGCDVAGTEDAGAAYVFERAGGSWSQAQKVRAWDAVARDVFAYHVAIDGNVLAASACDCSTAAWEGAVYVFRRLGAYWDLDTKLKGRPGFGTYGEGLDVDSDRIAIGQPYGGAAGGGLVELYLDTAAGWVREAELVHLYAAGLDELGQRVQLDGERLLAGARGRSVWFYSSGSALVFERAGGAWRESARLAPSVGFENDWLGNAVAVDGNALAVAGGEISRTVYLFTARPPVGTGFCAGDGSGTPCPCGNECEELLGAGCENGYGFGGWLAGCGSASVAADDLELSALHLTNNTLALLATSSFTVGGGLGVPFRDGLRCIGPMQRLSVRTSTSISGGMVVFGPGLGTLGGWTAGETRYFQIWYRDTELTCGTHVNTTNGLAITFAP